jgi:hypothetical protein
MVAIDKFIAKDYSHSIALQNRFKEYVALFTQLNFGDGTEALSSKDRNELNLKLEQAHNEITLLVLKLKQAKPNPEFGSITDLSSITSAKYISECRMAH